jgi:hypothetical protein
MVATYGAICCHNQPLSLVVLIDLLLLSALPYKHSFILGVIFRWMTDDILEKAGDHLTMGYFWQSWQWICWKWKSDGRSFRMLFGNAVWGFPAPSKGSRGSVGLSECVDFVCNLAKWRRVWSRSHSSPHSLTRWNHCAIGDFHFIKLSVSAKSF